MKVQDLINEAVGKKSGKKTKNTDLYLKTIIAIAEDDEYVAEYIESVSSTGEIVTKKEKLAPKFRKIIAKVIKKYTSMTQEEAEEAAKSFRLSQEDAATLAQLSGEAIYLNTKEFGKKVQLIHKPDMDVTLETIDVKEAVHKNPKDETKETVIAPRIKMSAKQKIHAFQKTVRIRK